MLHAVSIVLTYTPTLSPLVTSDRLFSMRKIQTQSLSSLVWFPFLLKDYFPRPLTDYFAEKSDYLAASHRLSEQRLAQQHAEEIEDLKRPFIQAWNFLTSAFSGGATSNHEDAVTPSSSPNYNDVSLSSTPNNQLQEKVFQVSPEREMVSDETIPMSVLVRRRQRGEDEYLELWSELVLFMFCQWNTADRLGQFVYSGQGSTNQSCTVRCSSVTYHSVELNTVHREDFDDLEVCSLIKDPHVIPVGDCTHDCQVVPAIWLNGRVGSGKLRGHLKIFLPEAYKNVSIIWCNNSNRACRMNPPTKPSSFNEKSCQWWQAEMTLILG